MTERRTNYTVATGAVDAMTEHPQDALAIIIDPRVCGGIAVFAGTRIYADTPARALLGGYGVEWVLSNYPTLTLAYVSLSIWYAYRRWPKDDRKRLRKWLRALTLSQLEALGGITSDGQLDVGWPSCPNRWGNVPPSDNAAPVTQ